MATAKKRKAITQDSPKANDVECYLNDSLSHSDGEGQQQNNHELDVNDQYESEIGIENHTEAARSFEYNHKSNCTLTTDANGGLRYIYKDIDPVYNSDESDAPVTTNTIGNIPLSFYDSYLHIGYDMNGKRISRPAKAEALGALLDTIEIPRGWTSLTNPATGKPLELNKEELDLLRRIHMTDAQEDGYDPYQATIEYFTSKIELMPLSAASEPKRRFTPSKHEAKRVIKILQAIRDGLILPYKPATDGDSEAEINKHDIWANEALQANHPIHIPAPKLPPPGHDESYHPALEYLPSQQETKAWEEAGYEDKTKEYLPTNHDSLRGVSGYEDFAKEKFERCLDLYLAPRVRRNKLNVDPESLLPKLPSPEALRPFPTACATVFRGHEGRIRSLSIDPGGVWLASGGDDGTVRVWELETARQVWSVKLASEEAVNVVCWRPGKDAYILSAAAGDEFFLIVPPLLHDPETESASRELLDAGWGYAANNYVNGTNKVSIPEWTRAGGRFNTEGTIVKATLRNTIKGISWHHDGNYFSTVCPQAHNSAVAIHTVSKHLTQLPFRRLKDLVQSALFHPSKPIFFVATQRKIHSYDLLKQELLKTIKPGARWISSFDVHPRGDNLIVGSYDKRLLWHDLDLSTRPYKTLRYHNKAIRAVKYHPGGLPLFADASDDGTLQIFHGKVVGDFTENATIVPLKVLRGHQVRRELGVLDLDWHPREPWCASAGADGTCRLWT
jgi:ribosome biogenesis protein ERB1